MEKVTTEDLSQLSVSAVDWTLLPNEIWCEIIKFIDQPLVLATVSKVFRTYILDTKYIYNYFSSRIETLLGKTYEFKEDDEDIKTKGCFRKLQKLMLGEAVSLGFKFEKDIKYLNIYLLPNYIEASINTKIDDTDARKQHISKWFANSIEKNYINYTIKTLELDNSLEISSELLGKCLIFAAKNGCKKSVDLLLNQKNAKAISSKDLGIALTYAVSTLCDETILQLLNHPNSKEIPIADLGCALCWASEKEGQVIILSIFELLNGRKIGGEYLAHALTLSLTNKFEKNALLILTYSNIREILASSASLGFIETVKYILGSLDASKVDRADLDLALYDAFRNEKKEIAEVILKFPKDQKLQLALLGNLLMWACNEALSKIAIEILNHPLYQEISATSLESSLQFAVMHKLNDVVKSILSHSNARGISSKTLERHLNSASKSSQEEIALLILDHPNAQWIDVRRLGPALNNACKNLLKKLSLGILDHPKASNIHYKRLGNSLTWACSNSVLLEISQKILMHPKAKQISAEILGFSLKGACINLPEKISLRILDLPNAKDISPKHLGEALSDAFENKYPEVVTRIRNHPNANKISQDILSETALPVPIQPQPQSVYQFKVQGMPTTILVNARTGITQQFPTQRVFQNILSSSNAQEISEEELAKIAAGVIKAVQTDQTEKARVLLGIATARRVLQPLIEKVLTAAKETDKFNEIKTIIYSHLVSKTLSSLDEAILELILNYYSSQDHKLNKEQLQKQLQGILIYAYLKRFIKIVRIVCENPLISPEYIKRLDPKVQEFIRHYHSDTQGMPPRVFSNAPSVDKQPQPLEDSQSIQSQPNAQRVSYGELGDKLMLAAQKGQTEEIRKILALPEAEVISNDFLNHIIDVALKTDKFDEIKTIIYASLISRRLDSMDETRLLIILNYYSSANNKLNEEQLKDQLQSILIYACSKNFIKIVKSILTYPYLSPKYLGIALEFAAMNKHNEIVKAILDSKNASLISESSLIYARNSNRSIATSKDKTEISIIPKPSNNQNGTEISITPKPSNDQTL